MAAKKTVPAKKLAPIVRRPASSIMTANAQLIAARQNAELVSRAGICNGMTQEECDQRLLALLGDGSASDTPGAVVI